MSIKYMNRVWEDQKLNTAAELLTMLALADWSDDVGACYPSIDRLALKIRKSRRTVQETIQKLAKHGKLCLKLNDGPCGTNRYFLYPAVYDKKKGGCENCTPAKTREGGAKTRTESRTESRTGFRTQSIRNHQEPLGINSDNHDNDVAKNSRASIDALKAALPEAESKALDEAYEDVDCVRLLKFWITNFKPMFGRGYGKFREADILAAQEIVRETEMGVQEICAALTMMWLAVQSMDAETHNLFWVCNHYTRSLTDLVKVHKGQERNNFERALGELNWRGRPYELKQATECLAHVKERRQIVAAEKS